MFYFVIIFPYNLFLVDVKRGAGCSPLILILFIDMVLLSTTKPVEEDCDAYMFASQEKLQRLLVVIAVICVPIILFGTPVYLNKIYKKKKEEALVRTIYFLLK